MIHYARFVDHCSILNRPFLFLDQSFIFDPFSYQALLRIVHLLFSSHIGNAANSRNLSNFVQR